jgi:hypothetical protein
MTKETIKKITVAVLTAFVFIVPQFAEEFKAMSQDPEFIQAVGFLSAIFFALITKAPEIPFLKNFFGKKEEK